MALDRALKEWAVVVDALLDGRQTVTLRKGGIAEEGGRFVPEVESFWLFPTYEHQTEDVLDPSERARYRRVLGRPRPEGAVEIPGWAACVDVFEVKTEEAARRMAPETIWTPDAVAARFRMMPGRPLYAMVLRVHRLPVPVAVPLDLSYGGCRSWVSLAPGALSALPDPAAAATALDDGAFAARRRAAVG